PGAPALGEEIQGVVGAEERSRIENRVRVRCLVGDWRWTDQLYDPGIGERGQYERERHVRRGHGLARLTAAELRQVTSPARGRPRMIAENVVRRLVVEVARPPQHLTHRQALQGRRMKQAPQDRVCGLLEESRVLRSLQR